MQLQKTVTFGHSTITSLTKDTKRGIPMIRKFSSVLVALILVLTMLVPAMAACEEAAFDEKNYEKACDIVEKANEKVADLVEHAQETAKDDVEKLIEKTTDVIDKAKEKVAALGFEVECTFTEYEVDGQTIKIDPLYVINPRPGSGNTNT